MINSRLWKAYCETLVKHPLRTRMATSGVLFAVGDTISQQGFEHRRTNHDFVRTARMAFYGSCIFAPLANAWFGTLQKVTMSNKAATVIARTGLDIFCWGSFITGVFWTTTGFLEGKTFEQVKAKVERVYPQALLNSWTVFGPAQIVNFSLIPPLHRLLFIQLVGLGWNTFLSYANNKENLAAETKARARSLVVDQIAI